MAKLSAKSIVILELIADGQSYTQIVDGHPEITYLDIFNAAKEALNLNGETSSHVNRLQEIKEAYPRAYEKWSDKEDEQLRTMHTERRAINEIAAILERQPSAIHSRLEKLRLA